MDIATVQRWIDACSKTYLEDTATHRWNPSNDPLAKPGWEVPNTFSINGWDAANLPVCNVYSYRGSTVRVNLDAYAILRDVNRLLPTGFDGAVV